MVDNLDIVKNRLVILNPNQIPGKKTKSARKTTRGTELPAVEQAKTNVIEEPKDDEDVPVGQQQEQQERVDSGKAHETEKAVAGEE